MADTSLWDYVGPAIQAGAGVAGALGGAGAASGGYNNAAGTIQGGIDTSYGALSPYSKTGSAAESALASLYGLGGQAPNYDAFTNSPGYQFQKQQGEAAINRGAAASGNGFSSTTLAQLGNYNSGLASTQYQQYLQNLYGLTQTGASAAGALGSQAITGATAQGTAQIGSGNANASGIAGAAGAVANAAGKLPWQQIGNYVTGGAAPSLASFGSGAAATGATGSALGSVGATTGGFDSTAIATGNQAWLGAQPAATGAGGPANYFGGVTAGATDAAAAGGLSSFGSGAAANAALADAGFGGATSVAPIATGAAEGGGYVGGGALASSGSSGAAAGSLAGGAVGLGILAAPVIAGMMTGGVQTNAAYAQKLNDNLFSNDEAKAGGAMYELLAAQSDPDNRVTITPAQRQRIAQLQGGLLYQMSLANPLNKMSGGAPAQKGVARN